MGDDAGEHRPLPADRGAGGVLSDLPPPFVKDVQTVTDVAVIGFAQSPVERANDAATTNGVEMLVPIFAEVLQSTGLTKDDIGFWCSGSSEHLAGRAFSFVSAVDAIGAVPPVAESHVEMDAAWALYEAWVKILIGDADIALAYGFGKSSAGDLRRVLALQLDPYLLAPLWPDSVSIAALQARLGIEAGIWSEAQMAEIAARSRASAVTNPQAQVSGEVSAEKLLEQPYLADPLRAHDCAPVGDGAAVVILASAARARELCPRPAWITGFEHRIDSASLGARDLTTAPSAPSAGRAAGWGGAWAGNPMFAAGRARIGCAAREIMSGRAGRALAHATSGPALQQNLVCVLEAE